MSNDSLPQLLRKYAENRLRAAPDVDEAFLEWVRNLAKVRDIDGILALADAYRNVVSAKC